MDTPQLTREQIARTYERIRPHIRRTPVLEVDAADFGLASSPIVLKLEFLQHAGSFKTRGAFTGLLTRPYRKLESLRLLAAIMVLRSHSPRTAWAFLPRFSFHPSRPRRSRNAFTA